MSGISFKNKKQNLTKFNMRARKEYWEISEIFQEGKKQMKVMKKRWKNTRKLEDQLKRSTAQLTGVLDERMAKAVGETSLRKHQTQEEGRFFLTCRCSFLTKSSHGREKTAETNCLTRASHSWPHPALTPSPNTTESGIRASTYDFWGHTNNSVHNTWKRKQNLDVNACFLPVVDRF